MPGWVEVMIRSIVLFVLIFLVAKMWVRKPVGEWSAFEGMLSIAAGGAAGVSAVYLAIPPAFPVFALLIWGFLPLALANLALRSETFRYWYEGKPVAVIQDGKILEDHMKKSHLSSDQLLRKLREKQAFQVADVEFALLEPNGEVNVLLKKEQQPLTPKTAQLDVPSLKEPETIVQDGEIKDEALARRGYSREWLQTEVEKLGITIENIFLAQVDELGELQVDLFDDKLQSPQPIEKPLFLSAVKKCQADLEGYALATDDQQAKAMYNKSAKDLEKVLNALCPILSQT
ncbi:DUF421 domain-containing protein [Thalassorhabdus alkalitolerans]|uniref:DUF421 domain-containing protein n=1 Tax=Thalassorhabdus alkalitolerans TaxID=2282697 RepID=A0ABW0YU78_9BACI